MKPKYEARFSFWREKWKVLVAALMLLTAATALSEREDRAVVALAMVLCGFFVIWIIIDILRYKLIITDTVLKGTESVGLFGKSVSLPIKQISSVEITQKALGRIFNYGTVSVTTARGIVAFKYVKNPHEVENEILQLM